MSTLLQTIQIASLLNDDATIAQPVNLGAYNELREALSVLIVGYDTLPDEPDTAAILQIESALKKCILLSQKGFPLLRDLKKSFQV